VSRLRGAKIYSFTTSICLSSFPGKPVDRNAHPVMLLAFNDSEHAHQVPRGKQRAMVLMDSLHRGPKERLP